MISWRDHILKEFPPGTAHLFLVADPDRLLTEERIAGVLRERGYDVLTYGDPVGFRFVYESRYRPIAAASAASPALIVRTEGEIRVLPFDLLREGRVLEFGLPALFPHLDYATVAALDVGDLDALYGAQRRWKPEPMGADATRDWVLRHVFELDPERVGNAADLLHLLLRRHTSCRTLPAALDAHFIRRLRDEGQWTDWPLERIVPEREAFFGFLQERWAFHLDQLAAQGEGVGGGRGAEGVREMMVPALSFPGPAVLPWEQRDVRAYVGQLFTEGELRPVPHPAAPWLAERGSWVGIGVRTHPDADERGRWERLLEVLPDALPDETARHNDWLGFARMWAEGVALHAGLGRPADGEREERWLGLRDEVDARFTGWMLRSYAALHNLPPVPPTMVHHVPRVLARALVEGTASRVALLVVDGLALDQWRTMRTALRDTPDGGTPLRFHEASLFGWVPTLTSVSRQALLAGKPPLFFPSSIRTTDREAALWRSFWTDEGLAAEEIGYRRRIGDGDFDAVRDLVRSPRLRAVAVVVDTVDRIMHGMELGTAGMHNQVRQWTEGGFPRALLTLLIEHGWAVYLTSDHGNTEAVGIGIVSEGVAPETRGIRARVYGDPTLRASAHAAVPEAIAWPAWGLPDDWLPLLAPARGAFIRNGERRVGHGGISIEEVVVPWVRVEG